MDELKGPGIKEKSTHYSIADQLILILTSSCRPPYHGKASVLVSLYLPEALNATAARAFIARKETNCYKHRASSDKTANKLTAVKLWRWLL